MTSDSNHVSIQLARMQEEFIRKADMKQTYGVSFPPKNHCPTSAGKSMEAATKPEPVRGAKEGECGARAQNSARGDRLSAAGLIFNPGKPF